MFFVAGGELQQEGNATRLQVCAFGWYSLVCALSCWFSFGSRGAFVVCVVLMSAMGGRVLMMSYVNVTLTRAFHMNLQAPQKER